MRADDHDRPLDPDPVAPTRAARSAARGFDRLVRPGRARRFSPRRLALAALIGAAVAWGGFEGGRICLRGLADWVAAQPEHQVAFAAIVLEPSPPPFVRRGAAGILDEVRETGRYPETISVLGVDAQRLRSDLKRSPWVEDVGAVRRSHRRLAVEVTYRRPVALMIYPNPRARSGTISSQVGVPVDRFGVAMDGDDCPPFDWQEPDPNWIPRGGQPLVQIRGFGPPEAVRIGQTWTPSVVGLRGGLLAQAIDLADLLVRHRAGTTSRARGVPEFRRIRLEPSTRRFWLADPDGREVIWGAGPGAEGSDEPKAAEKWELLERYVAAHGSLGLGADEVLLLEYPEARKVSTRPRPWRGSPSGTFRR